MTPALGITPTRFPWHPAARVERHRQLSRRASAQAAHVWPRFSFSHVTAIGATARNRFAQPYAMLWSFASLRRALRPASGLLSEPPSCDPRRVDETHRRERRRRSPQGTVSIRSQFGVIRATEADRSLTISPNGSVLSSGQQKRTTRAFRRHTSQSQTCSRQRPRRALLFCSHLFRDGSFLDAHCRGAWGRGGDARISLARAGRRGCRVRLMIALAAVAAWIQRDRPDQETAGIRAARRSNRAGELQRFDP